MLKSRVWQLALAAIALSAATTEAPAATESTTDSIDEIKVTAERLGLMGTSTTASQGIVVNDELALTPAYRVGQLLETVQV
jgi:hypothetical protein